MDITITGADIGTVLSIISVFLAFVFWWLSCKGAREIVSQTEEAKRVLGEIDRKMNDWQGKFNESTIKLIESRPEIIAQQVSMEEAKNTSDFMTHLSEIIDRLSAECNEESTGHKMALINTFLEHQKALGIEKDKVKAGVINQGNLR